MVGEVGGSGRESDSVAVGGPRHEVVVEAGTDTEGGQVVNHGGLGREGEVVRSGVGVGVRRPRRYNKRRRTWSQKGLSISRPLFSQAPSGVIRWIDIVLIWDIATNVEESVGVVRRHAVSTHGSPSGRGERVRESRCIEGPAASCDVIRPLYTSLYNTYVLRL